MAEIYDHQTFDWLGKPNWFPKNSPRWKRTELVRKFSGKTAGAFVKAAAGAPGFEKRDPRATLRYLAGKRAVSIEGHKTRATSEEMELRHAEIFAIVEEQQPMTVRQAFYQAVVRGLVDKSDGYTKVQPALVKMRRGETEFTVPYDWIIDNTRWERRPYTCTGIADALEDTAYSYRRTLWTSADPVVQVWLEKDALAGVIEPITAKYDVALMVSRGFSSITFLRDGAEKLRAGSRAYIYHLGDGDSHGKRAGEKIDEELRGYAPDVDLHFTRLAVTAEQIEKWDLPTRPDNKTGEDAVELDAIDPRELRKLVENALKKQMPPKKYKAMLAQQEREKDKIRELIDQIIASEDLDVEDDEHDDNEDDDNDNG